MNWQREYKLTPTTQEHQEAVCSPKEGFELQLTYVQCHVVPISV